MRPLSSLCALAADEERVPAQVREMLNKGIWSSTPGRWAVRAALRLHEPQLKPHQRDLLACLRLVRGAATALALVTDAGYESAVRYLSNEYADVAGKVLDGGGGAQDGSTAGSSAAAGAGAARPFSLSLGLLRQLAEMLPPGMVEQAQRCVGAGEWWAQCAHNVLIRARPLLCAALRWRARAATPSLWRSRSSYSSGATTRIFTASFLCAREKALARWPSWWKRAQSWPSWM